MTPPVTSKRPSLKAPAVVLTGAMLMVAPLQSQNLSESDVARRQLENGRGHLRRGNYDEALKDFQAVAESYPDSTLADNALLEMARYYSDVADDPEKAVKHADEIIRKYPTSDSAPHALLVKGEVVLARSRRRADLDAAVASFDRVSGIYPEADAVPRAQYLAAEALRLVNEPAAALQRYRHIVATFPSDPILPKVHIGAGATLAATGDGLAAMEELQFARASEEAREDAEASLARLTILYRLYVKPPQTPPYGVTASDVLTRVRATDVVSVLVTPAGEVLFAGKSGVAVMSEAARDLVPPGVVKPRGLAVDRLGRPVVIDAGTLRRKGIPPLTLSVPQGTSVKPLDGIVAAVNLRNGEWLVTSDDDRGIERFGANGRFIGVASPSRASRLALDELDRLAALDRDTKSIRLYDETGKPVAAIPQRGDGYELRNPVDLAFDALGHLYVLDRNVVLVFAPFGKQPALIRIYTEPDSSPGAFQRPVAFALDAYGRMFMADDRAEKIRVYN